MRRGTEENQEKSVRVAGNQIQVGLRRWYKFTVLPIYSVSGNLPPTSLALPKLQKHYFQIVVRRTLEHYVFSVSIYSYTMER